MMALARWDPFSPRKADRLFGSVVRDWLKAWNSDDIVYVHFACGCIYSVQPSVWTPQACRRHAA